MTNFELKYLKYKTKYIQSKYKQHMNISSVVYDITDKKIVNANNDKLINTNMHKDNNCIFGGSRYWY